MNHSHRSLNSNSISSCYLRHVNDKQLNFFLCVVKTVQDSYLLILTSLRFLFLLFEKNLSCAWFLVYILNTEIELDMQMPTPSWLLYILKTFLVMISPKVFVYQICKANGRPINILVYLNFIYAIKLVLLKMAALKAIILYHSSPHSKVIKPSELKSRFC